MSNLASAQSLAAIVAGGAMLATLSTAAANGRDVAAMRPSDADTRAFRSVSVRGAGGTSPLLALGVTFGAVLSSDGGETWRWSCEYAIGIGGGIYDPDYEVTASGKLFAAIPGGLRHTIDGCTWNNADLNGTFATAIAVSGTTILAATSEWTDSRIYRSTNDGDTFSVLSTPCTALVDPSLCGTGDWWKSIEIAKSNTDRVYLAGFVFTANPACQSGCDCANGECAATIKRQTLFRSDNGGASWTELSTAGFTLTPQTDLLVSAISPTNPDEIYIRATQTVINEASDIIYKSIDGGNSFTVFLDLSGEDVRREAPAVLVRANGDVWIGTKEGVYIGAGGVPPTEMVSTYYTVCLAENGGGEVIGCTNNAGPEMATLATTADGITWTPKMRFEDIDGPFECAVGTDQRDICADQQWCGLASQFGIPTMGCSGDAGTDGPTIDTKDPKCGCAANGMGSMASLGSMAAMALGLLWRRPRNRRR